MREEPIDYLSKVILTCYGQLSLTLAFCERSPEYAMPYQIFAALSKESLQQLTQYQIKEFQFCDAKYYSTYWQLILELAHAELERKSFGTDRLSPHSEIEDEANAMIDGMNIEELK